MNKKDCSYYLGLLTCVLALFWVYLVFSGLTSHQENGIDKVISKQKIENQQNFNFAESD